MCTCARRLVGALAIALLIYVLPFLSHLQLLYWQPAVGEGGAPPPQRLELWDASLSAVVVAFGAFTLVVGVGQSAVNLVGAA